MQEVRKASLLRKREEKLRIKINQALHRYPMISSKDKILLALSGGKDSIFLAYMLKKMGFDFEALFVDLEIGDYSKASQRISAEFCRQRNIPLHVVRARDRVHFSIEEKESLYPGQACSLCGSVKRKIFNEFALEKSFTVLLVAHNMDDEALFLFANNRRWDWSYLRKSLPVQEAKTGFVKRAKPLCFCREEEILLFMQDLSLEYWGGFCPYTRRHGLNRNQEILKAAESIDKDFIVQYYKNFLRNSSNFQFLPSEKVELKNCEVCGALTNGNICRVCRIAKGEWQHAKK